MFFITLPNPIKMQGMFAVINTAHIFKKTNIWLIKM